MQNRVKGRLIVLARLLLRETDEEHRLSGKELIDKLEKYDISCERKTIYDDIEIGRASCRERV